MVVREVMRNYPILDIFLDFLMCEIWSIRERRNIDDFLCSDISHGVEEIDVWERIRETVAG